MKKPIVLQPTRAHFVCRCGERLEFVALDRAGERSRIRCPRCASTWEQRLTEEEGDRGWTRSLVAEGTGDPVALTRSASVLRRER
jgi:hypothetical protein